MTDPEFESELREQRFRDVPSGWKTEILQAASACRQAAATPEAGRWREWLWPNPLAWSGLAAAWILIALLHLASTNHEASRAEGSTNPETLMVLENQRRLRNELLQDVQPPNPPSANRLQRRSETSIYFRPV